ncbi:MAG: phosphoglucosamine mutase, partial [Desulfurococcales archaeon ex4484_217_1]
MNANAGVIITASHNPPPDNGIKCFDGRGMEFTIPMEEKLEDIIFNEKFNYAKWDSVGRLEFYPEIIDDYMRELISRLRPQKIKKKVRVIVDCANGAASNITPIILRELGASVITVNCHYDGMFPGRIPEP